MSAEKFRYGVYGLSLDCDRRLEGLGGEPPAHWPGWTLSETVGPTLPGWQPVATGNHGRLALAGGGSVDVDRARRTIALRTPEPARAEAIVHPLLSSAIALVSHWLGRTAVHASAVIVEGRAFAILGPRGSGKSTTTAMLVDAGCGLLTDDLLVVDSGRVFAGPATIDLRRESAQLLGGTALGTVGRRERWRRAAPAPPEAAPLAGWVSLEWGAVASVEPVAAAGRMDVLAAGCPFPQPPEVWLDLVALPFMRFARPRSLTAAGAHLEQLLAALRAMVEA